MGSWTKKEPVIVYRPCTINFDLNAWSIVEKVHHTTGKPYKEIIQSALFTYAANSNITEKKRRPIVDRDIAELEKFLNK